MAMPQPFGIVPAGRPCITTPTSVPSETQYLYTLQSGIFKHIVVFILPGISLPPDTAAAVYLVYPQPNSSVPEYKFLGGIGPGKESAIFKLDLEEKHSQASELGLGISIESAQRVSSQIAALAAKSSVPAITTSNHSASQALIRPQDEKARTVLLAQRIIQNAFNFLASFSGNVPVPGGQGIQGVEVVPLKAFEDWWKKFETRVRSDPAFLEKDSD